MDCVVHFLRLLAMWWPGTQSARDNHLADCNFAKYSLILNCFHWQTFLIWLLTIPPNLKYLTTVPCNLSLNACFLTLMLHTRGSVATSARLGWIFNNHLL